MKVIPVSKNHKAYVDDDDYARISKYSWSYHGDGYAARGYNSKGKVIIIKLHHEIIGKAKNGFEIDHINGNKLDNRKSNLRYVTHQQNMFNVKKKMRTVTGVNPSKYKGVTWRNDRDKWRSCITYNGHKYYLGLYKTEQEAALAYNEAAVKYYGEYAKLNKIMEG